MKKQLFTLIILSVSILTFAQEKFEPTILILSPNETKYDKPFKKEVTEYNNSIVKNNNISETESYLKSDNFYHNPKTFER